MFDAFLLRAALAGLGTGLAAGLLGCFVVWRRMAYFGDATAHAAILGVALSLVTNLPIFAGVLVMALVMGLALDRLDSRGHEVNTALGVLAHSALALGLVAVALLPGRQVNLDLYLFGDVLTVGWGDIAVIWGGAAVVIGLLWWFWSRLLASTLTPDLAHAAGFDPRRDQRLLTLAIACVVAVAIKVVGALLIAALLIMPAAAARGLSRTPEAMAILSMTIAGIAAVAGLWMAVWLDTPVGPSIVCVAAGIYLLSHLATGR
ncbi:metal ABC transporter permease [Ponticoccus sp. SC2-23]|uniref:metal ABC transporter permease n=1 Tax=Alexandriicola marinus TaxID=2081710 RepID=UPI000FD9C581|nr:iron chelate uptake ABC transporter family permease subunit [Alexandriicola marinus]MBM1221179.1 metal ABC transporter permease [Ponticoccus sp. SC6-9]MBM1225749.1 metal ABC transporter permease [Ponticoccus sp. SC6-15]MBM1227901.1 metal ABC transporter permease [Ponticoccus sp. SC6-38]MBM1234461.1 metal ABC transporter permease [Ponticoccus sp. SC6-45]MBM1238403.1 metal ABC transporter permease [Ponticoccus sp. SC6-49]MBM1243672.1 metal ABC transporter permease [Ponticoccus sp. SC2-64]MB